MSEIEKLVWDNMRLIDWVARRHSIDVDLFADKGLETLRACAIQYDETKGTFATYARKALRTAVLKHKREKYAERIVFSINIWSEIASQRSGRGRHATSGISEMLHLLSSIVADKQNSFEHRAEEKLYYAETDKEIMRQKVANLISKLAPDERELLLATVVDGKSLEQYGYESRTIRSTLCMRRKKLLEKLRAELKRISDDLV